MDDTPVHTTPRPIPSTIAVVVKDGRVLLVRRANAPDAGVWGFPGGKMDMGETIYQAAVRELVEETGVRAEAGPIIAAMDAFDRNADGDLRAHYVLIAVLCRWVSGKPLAGDDAMEAAWFDLESLTPAVPMSEGVWEIAQKAAKILPPSSSEL